MFSALILLAIWHGIVLLPVLLSLVGPPSYRSAHQAQAEKGGPNEVEVFRAPGGPVVAPVAGSV